MCVFSLHGTWLKDSDGHGLKSEEIIDEIQAFLFAGHDTTSSGNII